MAHTNGSEQRNGSTHDAAQLRQLCEKFEAGTASAQETLSWLDHLLQAAQQRGDQEWIPVLYRLREAQAAAFARGPETTLRDPADPQQYLAWISPTQIRPSLLYEDEPVDDVTLTALVESIQQEGGLHDPLFVSTDHEIIHGRIRWLAWQRAGLDAHRRVPVLVKPLSAAQKKRAFLSTKVVGQRTALLRSTTAARQYAAALAAMPVTSASDMTAVASPQSPGTEHAVTLPTLVARIAVLPDSERRLLTRQLVAEDAMLQDTLLAEAESHVGSSDEKRRLTAELQHLRRTLEEISTEQDRRQHTVDQLEEQLAQARVQRAELDSVVEELQRAKQELEQGRKATGAEIQTLRTRVQQLAPLERLAGVAKASAVIPLILDLIEVTGKKLFPTLFRYLQPSSAPTAATELARMLDEVETLVQQCRQRLQHPPVIDHGDQPWTNDTHTQEAEA